MGVAYVGGDLLKAGHVERRAWIGRAEDAVASL